MKYALAILALAASTLANPMPQAVTSDLFPTPSAAPPGCVSTVDSVFEITVVNATGLAKRGIGRRQGVTCGGDGTLLIKLTDGKLFDSKGRQGYIASNRQYQFDGPPQAGALITDGFSVCPNSTLALGGSTVFYQCLSGTFFNLYDQSQGGQCSPAFIDTIPCSGGGATAFSTLSLPTGAAPTPGPTGASTSGTVTTATVTSANGPGVTPPIVSQSFPSNATFTGVSTTATLSITGPIVTGNSTVSATGAKTGSTSKSAGTPTGTAGGASGTSAAPSATTTSSGGSPAINGGKEFMAFAAGVAALVMI